MLFHKAGVEYYIKVLKTLPDPSAAKTIFKELQGHLINISRHSKKSENIIDCYERFLRITLDHKGQADFNKLQQQLKRSYTALTPLVMSLATGSLDEERYHNHMVQAIVHLEEIHALSSKMAATTRQLDELLAKRKADLQSIQEEHAALQQAQGELGMFYGNITSWH